MRGGRRRAQLFVGQSHQSTDTAWLPRHGWAGVRSMAGLLVGGRSLRCAECAVRVVRLYVVLFVVCVARCVSLLSPSCRECARSTERLDHC